jgi:hypothetical protein
MQKEWYGRKKHAFEKQKKSNACFAEEMTSKKAAVRDD